MYRAPSAKAKSPAIELGYDRGGKNVIGGRAVVNLTSIKKSGVRATRQQSLELSGRQVLRPR